MTLAARRASLPQWQQNAGVGPEAKYVARVTGEYLSSFFELSQCLTRTYASARFHSLVAQWKVETRVSSSVADIVMNPAYQRIIAMGEKAVPLILRELERELDHWFWALEVLTDENPVSGEHEGNMVEMRERWMEWGRRNDLI